MILGVLLDCFEVFAALINFIMFYLCMYYGAISHNKEILYLSGNRCIKIDCNKKLLQVNVKKRLVYGAVMFIWIFVPVYLTTIGSLGTDIVKGICVPLGVYSSYAIQATIVSTGGLITYMLPLVLLVFCYSRIVYALKHKVSNVVLTVKIILYTVQVRKTVELNETAYLVTLILDSYVIHVRPVRDRHHVFAENAIKI